MPRLPVLLLLVLVACTAPPEPAYRLEPPANAADPAVRACLAGCDAARDRCRGPALERLRTCEERATLQLAHCESRARTQFDLCQRSAERTGRICVRRACFREICAPVELEACAAGYRACFVACGGTVSGGPG